MNGSQNWPFDQPRNVAAITDASIVEDAAPILLVIHYSEDDSWAFLSGGIFDISRGRFVSMGEVLDLDPTLHSIADLPSGWSATRPTAGEQWIRQLDPDV
jgi:hypothetical protein